MSFCCPHNRDGPEELWVSSRLLALFRFVMSEVKPPALFCTYRSLSPQGRIQWWKGQALTVWHSCMLMSENLLFFSLCYLAASSTQTRGLSHCLLCHICRAFPSQMEIPEHWPTSPVILGQRLLCNMTGSWTAFKLSWCKPGLTSWESGFTFIT